MSLARRKKMSSIVVIIVVVIFAVFVLNIYVYHIISTTWIFAMIF